MVRRWLALALTVSLAAPAQAAPRRVVSLTPCVDAILMQVADPGQIAAISHYSRDPQSSSIPLAQARHFPITYETAEEVIALKPDLVIAGRHVALSTRNALARLGVPILSVEVAESIDGSRDQIRQIAAVLGHPERGIRLVARIDAALVAAAPPPSPPVMGLIWQGAGLVPGKGTLGDELLTRTGFANASVAYGLRNWDMLPLEHLLARPPAVIFTRTEGIKPRSQTLRRRIFERLSTRVVVRDFPERLLYCAGPNIIEAVARLSQARRAAVAKGALR